MPMCVCMCVHVCACVCTCVWRLVEDTSASPTVINRARGRHPSVSCNNTLSTRNLDHNNRPQLRPHGPSTDVPVCSRARSAVGATGIFCFEKSRQVQVSSRGTRSCGENSAAAKGGVVSRQMLMLEVLLCATLGVLLLQPLQRQTASSQHLGQHLAGSGIQHCAAPCLRQKKRDGWEGWVTLWCLCSSLVDDGLSLDTSVRDGPPSTVVKLRHRCVRLGSIEDR